MNDPTAFDIRFDPNVQRMDGVTNHGNIFFNVPFISHVKGNLWQGGTARGLVLPENIEHLISMYKWEQYTVKHPIKTNHVVTMYDSNQSPGVERIVKLATLVNKCAEDGPTLVVCQAGLNRSGLVAAFALVLQGMDGQDAIDLLREKRSPAVLCNGTFEKMVLDFSAAQNV